MVKLSLWKVISYVQSTSSYDQRANVVYSDNGYVHSPLLKEKEAIHFGQNICTIFFID